MTALNDRNARIIAEFRANEGRVGEQFEGAPIALVHHYGRNSGRERINPVMYLRDAQDPDTIYVFATKAGAPVHPDWYRNLTAIGKARVECGTEEYEVTVRDLQGEERDRIYAEQARLYPAFVKYASTTAGIRIIPVLALRRV